MESGAGKGQNTSVQVALSELGCTSGSFMKMYRASDLDETCQRVLMQHAPQSRPEHVMGSLFDRIEPKDVEKLKKLVSKGVTRYHAKRSLGGVAPEEKKRMGKRLFKQAMLCVRKARFKKTVPCKSCGRQCKTASKCQGTARMPLPIGCRDYLHKLERFRMQRRLAPFLIGSLCGMVGGRA